MPKAARLVLDDFIKVHRAADQDYGDDYQEHGNFVGDILGHHPRGGNDGVFVPRRPTAQHDGHHVDGAEGKDHQQPNIDVPRRQALAKRNNRQPGQHRRHHQQRSQAEQAAVHPGRNDQLFREQLDGVGDRLQQTGGPDLGRTGPALKSPRPFSLDPHQIGRVESDEGHDSHEEEQQPQRLGPKSRHECSRRVHHSEPFRSGIPALPASAERRCDSGVAAKSPGPETPSRIRWLWKWKSWFTRVTLFTCQCPG